jgi:Flp pilus assembly protein TadD
MNLGILLACADPIEEVRRALEEPSMWPSRPSPRWAEAADHLVRAVRGAPELDQARLHLGGLCVRTGRVDEARALLRSAAMARPLDPDVHAWLALAAVRIGDRDEAVAELAEAVRLHPTPQASAVLDRARSMPTTTATTPSTPPSTAKPAATAVASSR